MPSFFLAALNFLLTVIDSRRVADLPWHSPQGRRPLRHTGRAINRSITIEFNVTKSASSSVTPPSRPTGPPPRRTSRPFGRRHGRLWRGPFPTSPAAFHRRPSPANFVLPWRQTRVFKQAKKALGLQSRRDGFGRDGMWYWSLPTQPHRVPQTRVDPLAQVPERDVGTAVYGRGHSRHPRPSTAACENAPMHGHAERLGDDRDRRRAAHRP